MIRYFLVVLERLRKILELNYLNILKSMKLVMLFLKVIIIMRLKDFQIKIIIEQKEKHM